MSEPLGQIIDRLYTARAHRLEVEAEVKQLKKQEAELKAEIMAKLAEAQLNSGRGEVATASITHSTVPNITDWDAVYGFIMENQMFELLHRRITTALWGALEEEGRHVPGTEAVVVTDLSLTKATR
jgi:hypothetical protein